MSITIEWEDKPKTADSGLEQFKIALRQLAFREVDYVIKERKNATALRTSDGGIVTKDDPAGFSSVASTLSLADWENECVRYSFYYGKTIDEVYFCKSSRGNGKIHFTPAFPKDYYFGRPLPHETIVGVIIPSDRGGLRYEWWDCATKADQRFVEMILGKRTFSTRQKMETKLTVGNNRLLFHLVMALHFSDVDYFVDLAKRDQYIDEGPKSFSVDEWLTRHLMKIIPNFCNQVLGKI